MLFRFQPQGGDTVSARVPVDVIGRCGRGVRAGGRWRVHVGGDVGDAAHHGRVYARDVVGGRRETEGLGRHHGRQVGVHRGVHVHVESPGKGLRAERGGDLGGPVVVGVPRVESIVERRLHQARELGAEAVFERVHISLPLPPFRSSVLEPYLQEMKVLILIIIIIIIIIIMMMMMITNNINL